MNDGLENLNAISHHRPTDTFIKVIREGHAGPSSFIHKGLVKFYFSIQGLLCLDGNEYVFRTSSF